MERTKRRIPIISFLLSIVLPGLGHVYNGHLREGIVFFVGFWFLFFALAMSGILSSLQGLVAFIATVTTCPILIAIHAAIEAARLKMADLKWYNRWYVYVAVLAVFNLTLEPIVLYGQHNLIRARTFKMSSSSMAPTLKAGDYLLAKLERYRDRVPTRGEIVIFPYPEDRSKIFVHRIIGLPGEQFQIKDKVVFINGERLDDRWGHHLDTVTFPGKHGPRDNLGPTTIPDGAVLVLGDNRDYSADSRFWGFVDIKEIEGKALYIYWSADRSRIGNRLN